MSEILFLIIQLIYLLLAGIVKIILRFIANPIIMLVLWPVKKVVQFIDRQLPLLFGLRLAFLLIAAVTIGIIYFSKFIMPEIARLSGWNEYPKYEEFTGRYVGVKQLSDGILFEMSMYKLDIEIMREGKTETYSFDDMFGSSSKPVIGEEASIYFDHSSKKMVQSKSVTVLNDIFRILMFVIAVGIPLHLAIEYLLYRKNLILLDNEQDYSLHEILPSFLFSNLGQFFSSDLRTIHQQKPLTFEQRQEMDQIKVRQMQTRVRKK